MIVLLHGSGRDGSTLVEPWKDLADKEGLVLVGPNAHNAQGWSVPADGPELLCALADHVVKTQPVVDPRRVYLFGHSAGAVFTLNMAMLEPQYFAAAALHAGAWRSPDEFVYLDVAVRKIPMGIWVGDRDAFFAVRDVNATADALAKAGHPVKVEIIKNHDHNYYVMSSDVNRAAWAFLKTCQLETDPQYIAHRFQ